jgi:hypothetical protein
MAQRRSNFKTSINYGLVRKLKPLDSIAHNGAPSLGELWNLVRKHSLSYVYVTSPKPNLFLNLYAENVNTDKALGLINRKACSQ